MAKREKVTSGQVQEMTGWLRRLTPKEYQARRALLRRATDPKSEIGPKLLYPFKDERPLEWGWIILREGGKREGKINIAKLEAVPFHKDREDLVPGEEMLRRARDGKEFPGCAEWSMYDAEELLARADELPKEWARDDGPVLLFPDTEFAGGDGYRLVAYLFWEDGQWRLGWWGCARGDFYRYCRFLRLRK